MKLFSFRNLRVLLLLILLAYVAIYTKSQRIETMAWLDPLEVVILPINADGDPATALYIEQLSSAQFEAIDEFMSKQGKRYGVLAKPPVITFLGPEVSNVPPPSPGQDASRLAIAWWSLTIRYWAWINTPEGYGGSNTIQIFVLYQQPLSGERLAHSLGLQKGLLGIVHAYANTKSNEQNNIVITHEMFHTVGASDKYIGPMPIYPQGYAAPGRSPLHPQTRCEIMAGKIATSASTSRLATSLKKCVVGPDTATEINWIEISQND